MTRNKLNPTRLLTLLSMTALLLSLLPGCTTAPPLPSGPEITQTYRVDASSVPTVDRSKILQSAMEIVEARLGSLNHKVRVNRVHGSDTSFTISFPQGEDAKQVQRLTSTVGSISWHIVSEPHLQTPAEISRLRAFASGLTEPARSIVLDEEGRPIVVENTRELRIDGPVQRATVSQDHTGRPSLLVDLTPEQGKRLGALTTARIGKQLCLNLDGQALLLATINSSITTGQTQISGDFDSNELIEMQTWVTNPALPAAVELVSEVVRD